MKIISILILTLTTIASAMATPITGYDQVPIVNNRQRTFLIENGSADTILMIEHYLHLTSELLDGESLVIVTSDDVYDGFYNDFYDVNHFNPDCGIALCHNKKTGEFHVLCRGSMLDYEEFANEKLNEYLSEKSEDSEVANYLVYNHFALDIVGEFVLNDDDDDEFVPDSTKMPENNWGKYVIGRRTHDEPLIHKQFIIDDLTEEKISHALSTPYVDTALKVYDAANLLTESEYDTIQYYVKDFVNTYNVDMVIVTLNRNCKEDDDWNNQSEVYAMDFFEYNDFGKGKPTIDGYDGVILLIDMHYRNLTVLDVGKPKEYGVASYNLDKYMDGMISWLDNDDYYNAILYFIFEYGSDYDYEASFPWVKCILFALLIGWICIAIERKKYKTIQKATSAADYIVPDSFKLSRKSDIFVSTHTTKRYSPKSSSSGGHHSSSGRSFGGGSRRF